MSGTAPEFVGQHSGTFNSMEQAEIDARRVLRQARWTNIAEVTCLGYRNMKPGRCVLINDRDGEYGGFWYVTDTCHTFDYMTQTTSTAASMCRDTTDLRTRQNAVRIDPLTYPTPRLSQGSWQSDRQWDKIIE